MLLAILNVFLGYRGLFPLPLRDVMWRVGGERAVVVLLLEGRRVDGHGTDGATQEINTDYIPPRVPSRDDAQHLVVGHDIHTWRTL